MLLDIDSAVEVTTGFGAPAAWVPLMMKSLSSLETGAIARALERGGYIAGGWVRAYYHATAHAPKDVATIISRYLNMGGDVDIFFESRSDMNDVVSSLGSEKRKTKNTYSYGGHLQFITCHYCRPREMLKTFDISNGMLALTARGMIIPRGYLSLDSSGALHVSQWHSTSGQRMHKWFSKQVGLTHLHHDCVAEYMTRRKDFVTVADSNNDYTALSASVSIT